MPDFKFIRIPNFESWIISAPHRASRSHTESKKATHVCPFCPGNPNNEIELYRLGGSDHDDKWQIKVIPNKYPFAPIHEVVIQTPQHAKELKDFTLEEMKLVFEVFVNRFNTHLGKGSVCIFANAGTSAGESIHHSHSQIAVVPKDVPIIVPRLEEDLEYQAEHFEVGQFNLICPPYSQWPDEVWVVPHNRGKLFGEITMSEVEGISYILRHLLRILTIRHNGDFPFNFYIYPFRDWYLRLLPRSKTPGGFEMATGIFVNTQDPRDTMEFIKKHLFEEDTEKIQKSTAEYRRGV